MSKLYRKIIVNLTLEEVNALQTVHPSPTKAVRRLLQDVDLRKLCEHDRSLDLIHDELERQAIALKKLSKLIREHNGTTTTNDPLQGYQTRIA